MDRCPRSDPQNWNPNDSVEVDCPGCGKGMEFFADEKERKCRGCGQTVVNPQYQAAE